MTKFYLLNLYLFRNNSYMSHKKNELHTSEYKLSRIMNFNHIHNYQDSTQTHSKSSKKSGFCARVFDICNTRTRFFPSLTVPIQIDLHKVHVEMIYPNNRFNSTTFSISFQDVNFLYFSTIRYFVICLGNKRKIADFLVINVL